MTLIGPLPQRTQYANEEKNNWSQALTTQNKNNLPTFGQTHEKIATRNCSQTVFAVSVSFSPYLWHRQ